MIQKIKILLKIILISFLLIGNVFAQETEELFSFTLEELMNIKIDVASRESENIFSTPSTVVVIDKEMIEEYNLQNIGEAINLVAGISNTRTFFKRNIPTIRGILQDNYANKVLVMINGIPSWHATAGEGNIDRVDIHDVERIEILKGPASVLYGSNALTGAINIVLKKPDKEKLDVHFQIGENGFYNGGGNFSLAKEDYSLFISGNSSTENGSDYYFTDELDSSGYVKEFIKSSNFNLNMKYLEHSLLFNAYQVDESYLGKLPRFSFGAGKNHLATGYLFNYSFAHNFSDKFKINTNATFDWNLRDLASSSDDNARAINEGYRLFANLYLTYLPTKTWQFEVGSDYDFRHNIRVDDYLVHEDKVIFHNNSRDRKLSEYSFYGQLQYSNYGFNIVAGARTTQNELFGNNVSYRITTLYKFNKNNSLKVIYGFSFRAPSFFELYFVTPFFTVFGNPNLQPERAKSGEVVYLTSFNHFFIQILTYHGTYYDKIHREIKNIEYNNVLYKNKNVYVNGKTFKSYGVEFEMKYRNPSLFNSFIYYSYTIGDKGDEVNNNYNFKYVPLHTSSIGISKKINNFEISTVINYWSKTNGPISEIAPQIFADVSLSFFQIYNGFKIKHALSVRNLTDEKIMVPEYVRRTTINEISFGFGRRIMYNINISI